MKHRVDKFIKNPKKALFKLALPVVITMLVLIMYNIVDTIFVGRLGAESIAALTFTFPVFYILVAFNSGIGAGIASRISRFMGEKKKKAAENTAMHGILISITFAVIVFTLGMIFLKPMFHFFGATGNVFDLAIGYMSVILFGVFFLFPSSSIDNIFTGQGDTKTAMKVYIFSLSLNIVLDYLFIFTFGLGVKGAAYATIISFFSSFVLLSYFIRTKSYLHLKKSSFRFSKKIIKEILKVGMPASVSIIFMSLYIVFINKFMAHFGFEYVAVFGITRRIQSVVILPVIAFSIALMTLSGMFFGAKRYDLLKGIINYALKVTLLFSIVSCLIIFIFPSIFFRVFTPDQNLISLGSLYLQFSLIAYPFFTVALVIGRAIQGMGFGFPGLVIHSIRTLLIAIPIAYYFVFILGLNYLSIAVAMVIGGIISAGLAYIWLKVKLRKCSNGC